MEDDYVVMEKQEAIFFNDMFGVLTGVFNSEKCTIKQPC